MLGEESLEGSDKFKKSDEQKNERNKNKEKA